MLFPGVDPTPAVEGLGKKMAISTSNGKFTNISMGQGQEAVAKGGEKAKGLRIGNICTQRSNINEEGLMRTEEGGG